MTNPNVANQNSSGNYASTGTAFDNQYSVATITDKTTNIVYEFPFNINTLNWTYEMNTQSYSTIGGRVTQLLSVKINTLNVQGEAGSRKKLMDLYNNFKTIQDNQNTSKVSMVFSVPSQNLSWHVFLEQMQMAWDYTTVTYPYTMLFEVDQDLNQTATNLSATDALNRISNGVGFNTNWLGLTTTQVNVQFNNTQPATSTTASTPSRNRTVNNRNFNPGSF